MWPHPIRAVIFDVDGLLLDSEGIFLRAMKDVTGHEMDVETHLGIMGTTPYDCGKIIMERYGIEGEPLPFMAEFDKHLNVLLPEAPLMPGAAALVNKLDSMGMPMAIATGSNTENLKAKTINHQGLFALFKAKTCGNEVKNGKPNPEIFLKSLSKLGDIDPQNTLVFEDAPAGVKAAVSAGMAVVMVPNKEYPFQQVLSKLGATPTLMLDSLEDFDFNQFKFE